MHRGKKTANGSSTFPGCQPDRLNRRDEGNLFIFPRVLALRRGFLLPRNHPLRKEWQVQDAVRCRQRPQSVLIKGNLFVVYNGDASPTKDDKGKACLMLISYDPTNGFSPNPSGFRKKANPTTTSAPSSGRTRTITCTSLWLSQNARNLPRLQTARRGTSPRNHLEEDAPIAPKLSYPTVYRIHGDKEVIYYRTDGHTSSWTYKISADNGKTWSGPERDVTDLDAKGRLDWSSYQVKIPSRDGKRLHAVFTDYDDNKNSPAPQRFYNPRYDRLVNNEWKYNLSYLSIDLRNHALYNADGASHPPPRGFGLRKSPLPDLGYRMARSASLRPSVWTGRKSLPSFTLLSGKNHALMTITTLTAKRAGGSKP